MFKEGVAPEPEDDDEEKKLELFNAYEASVLLKARELCRDYGGLMSEAKLTDMRHKRGAICVVEAEFKKILEENKREHMERLFIERAARKAEHKNNDFKSC